MIQKSLSNSIFDREQGSVIEPASLKNQVRMGNYFTFAPATPKVCIDVFGSTEVDKNDEIIWIGAKENILITLNCSGQVILYNLLSSHPPKILNSYQEIVVKSFYAPDHLALTVKTRGSENLSFYLLPFSSLQSSNPTRIQALPSLSLNLSALVEIHSISCKIVIKANESIQIWNLLTNLLEFTFPVLPQISYKYSGDYFIYWGPEKNETKVAVFHLLTSKTIYFNLKTQEKINFLHVYKNSIILGVNRCKFQKICLETMDCVVIYDKVPALLVEFQLSAGIFTVFRDGSCMVNFSPKNIFDAGVAGDVCVCEGGGAVLFCDCFGRLGIIDKGKFYSVQTGLVGVEAMGCNLDTADVYMVCQGKIFVYE